MDQQDVNTSSESRPSSTSYHNMRRRRISFDQLEAENATRNARRRANYHARKHVSSSSAEKGKSIIIDTSTSQHSQENENPMNVDCRPTFSRTIFSDITNVINNEAILYNGESSSSTHHHIVQNEASNIPQPMRASETHTRGRTRERAYHRCSWNYHDLKSLPMLQLSTPKPCCHCQSRLFHHESSQLCCQSGKVTLPSFEVPDELYSLYSDQTAIGAHFRHNIRKYNHVFSFTSMGVHVDETLANARSGAYAFKAQGAVYHRVGGFLPTESRPRFLQMYFYDTEHELEHRLSENRALRGDLIKKIKEILDRHSPFVKNFRCLAQRDDLQHCRLIIHEQPTEQRQYCLPTASQVAGIIIGGEEVTNLNDRDIIIESSAGYLMNIRDTTGYYDPTDPTVGQSIVVLFKGIPYLAEHFMHIFCRWIRDHQKEIRAEMYQGLQDCLKAGECNPENVGQRVILPSSFVGSPRDMSQRYQDAMAIVQKYAKPDIFLTMTCNPSWKEITDELYPGQIAADRPDIITRIFHAKLTELVKDVWERGVLGKVTTIVYVVEFQKRGLPHVHMLLILDEHDKPRTPDEYDKIVRAEIPNKNEEPHLYKVVLKHMIHGPCGVDKRNPSCIKNGDYKRSFPKQFSSITYQGNDTYPIYRRRKGSPVPLQENGSTFVDNSWVVPYNVWLLLKYDCHINVEICSSIKSVKYLYKYVHKGPDRVAMEVRAGPNYNEIQQFVDARWVCAPESFWRLFMFPLYKLCPLVERLQLHLPNMQQVRYPVRRLIQDVVGDPTNSRTMLTEFFKMNVIDPEARNFLYREFPEHYRWMSTSKTWRKRVSNQRTIGRIYNASPMEGDRFFLRVLLNHVRGPQSFEHLCTVNGITYPSFKEADERLDLLEYDGSVRECLMEACTTRMPTAIRRLFVTMLVYCQPARVRDLWDEFFPHMAEDYLLSTSTSNTDDFIRNCVLHDMERLLKQLGKRIEDFDLPRLSTYMDSDMQRSRAIFDEISAPVPDEDLNCVHQLNTDQHQAFDTIMYAIDQNNDGIFFIDGPGGTGKTFLYRAILASVKQRGKYGLATSSSGIAATLLHRGKTAHKTFRIPIKLDASSMCAFSKQSIEGHLIKHASVIIWDEATMTHRYAFEAVDCSLRDLMGIDLPFGGKVMVFGGDFRQVLPVIPKGTIVEMIDACFARSSLWTRVRVLKLKQNMRSRLDEEFASFLLRVGDGDEPTIEDSLIKLPPSITLSTHAQNSIGNLIDFVFPNIQGHGFDVAYMVERAIVTPTNEDVMVINEKILEKFVGDEHIYYSYDSVPDDTHNLYSQEFLNSLSFGGLPPHVLRLKVRSPIMLLRNIDANNGLCNGTRLICCQLKQHLIEAEILTGHCKGKRVFIPRIPLKTAEDAKLPFEMTRKQFPVKLCFALTINKAQGQMIPHVGIYLPQHVFSHGQLYVALSRGTSQHTTKVMVNHGHQRTEGVYTRNVVYKEIFNERI